MQKYQREIFMQSFCLFQEIFSSRLRRPDLPHWKAFWYSIEMKTFRKEIYKRIFSRYRISSYSFRPEEIRYLEKSKSNFIYLLTHCTEAYYLNRAKTFLYEAVWTRFSNKQHLHDSSRHCSFCAMCILLVRKS